MLTVLSYWSKSHCTRERFQLPLLWPRTKMITYKGVKATLEKWEAAHIQHEGRRPEVYCCWGGWLKGWDFSTGMQIWETFEQGSLASLPWEALCALLHWTAQGNSLHYTGWHRASRYTEWVCQVHRGCHRDLFSVQQSGSKKEDEGWVTMTPLRHNPNDATSLEVTSSRTPLLPRSTTGQDQAFNAWAFGRHCKLTPEPWGSSHHGTLDTTLVSTVVVSENQDHGVNWCRRIQFPSKFQL